MLKSFQTLTPGAGSSPLHCVNGKQSVSGVNNFMGEIWKPVPGLDGIFSVSDFGRVKSHKRVALQKLRNGKYNKLFVAEKILSTWVGGNYKQIRLWHNGSPILFLISRLVLMAFVGMPIGENNQALHINHNKLDNRLVNLKWGSRAENMRMDWNEGRRKPYSHWVGKNNWESPVSKPVKQYSISGEFIKEWPCAAQIERSLGIPFGNISNNCRGITKKTGGYVFKFSERKGKNVGTYKAI